MADTIKKLYKRRSNGGTYEVTFSGDTGRILKVVNLTGIKHGPHKGPCDIPLSSDTVKKHMIRNNFKQFTEIK